MSLSSTDLALIAARASNLTERLSGQFVPAGNQDSLAESRLSNWKQIAAVNDSQRFADLFPIEWVSHAAEEKLLPLLGAVCQPHGPPLPSWACLLDDLIRALASRSAGNMSPLERTTWPVRSQIPFEQLYRPIAEFAQTRVDNAFAGRAVALAPHARWGLQRSLVQRISTVCSTALQPAFLAYKATRESAMFAHFFAFQSETKSGSGDGRLYEGFVAGQLREGLASFWLRYPVAARLTATVTLFWIKFVEQFLQNLEGDQRELSDCFNGGKPLGIIETILGGMSDPHQDGKAVLILKFVCGRRLVYKPRPLEVDRVFFGLVDELNECRAAPDLPVLKTLGRNGYGWMEFADHAPCRDHQAARRFYRRAGALACLVHRLQGVDCHRENLVAAGEYPVLVDLESLAHPLRPEEEAQTPITPHRILSNSVLRTGLLPLWLPRPLGSGFYDLSGLGAPVALRAVYPTSRWRHTNTDQMQLSSATRIQRHSGHRPRIGHRMLRVQDFERDLVSGFRQMATLLNGRFASEFYNWQRLIQSAPRRTIKRPTALYGLLVRRSLRPVYLVDGVDRSIALQALSGGTNEARWKEVESLEQLDIPYFHVASENCSENIQLLPGTAIQSVRSQIELVRQSLRQNVTLSGNEILCRKAH